MARAADAVERTERRETKKRGKEAEGGPVVIRQRRKERKAGGKSRREKGWQTKTHRKGGGASFSYVLLSSLTSADGPTLRKIYTYDTKRRHLV